MSPNFPTQLNYGLTQTLARDMNQRSMEDWHGHNMSPDEKNSQQMVPTSNTTAISFGSQVQQVFSLSFVGFCG